MNDDDAKHLKSLIRHIDNVRASCLLLGERLIENGKDELGLQLIANGHIHDASKFHGIEWEYLRDETKESHPIEFALALKHHQHVNPHHPEYWTNGIKSMPPVYLAEMVCDWKARSNEFATGLRSWIKQRAIKRWNFTVQSKEYKLIKGFVDVLLDSEFK